MVSMGSHGWVGRWVFGWVLKQAWVVWVDGWVEWVGSMGWVDGLGRWVGSMGSWRGVRFDAYSGYNFDCSNVVKVRHY